jgi:hypothetical protein
MMDLANTHPPIPDEIFQLSLEEADLAYGERCQELWDEVIMEVLDPHLMTRSHHKVSTYDAGCRGPLCRKAHREHPRRKKPTPTPLALREERIYDPVLEYFFTVMKYRLRAAEQHMIRESKEK